MNRMVWLWMIVLFGVRTEAFDPVFVPYVLDSSSESRSISFENPTGAKGAGGQAASNLGVGRKGAPAKSIKAGETVELCNITGPGVIHHLWMTTRQDPENLRGLVLRAWWDGQAHPSIECPVGDLMGFAHGKVTGYHSAVHSVGPRAGMNLWLPMPFAKSARLTLTNEMPHRGSRLYYQIDYTLGPVPSDRIGCLHVSFRRENPTTLKRDFEILPRREGSGRYIGCVLGVRPLDLEWWGEGEVKMYIDGDEEFPTICGTGTEDYAGLSWGMQEVTAPFNGCNLNQEGYISFYRWHLPDPINWKRDIRVTIQQLGSVPEGYSERQDDWSAAAFWYEQIPSQPLPAMPSFEQRSANLPTASFLCDPIGAISPIEAIHVAEREVEGFDVSKVEVEDSAGIPLYAVQGKVATEEISAYIHADTARLNVLARKGTGMELRNGVLTAAHRGASRLAPENTLAAIRKAVELGADIIEMDIRQTKDGHLVLMHNSDVSHTTDGEGKVADLTLEQIKSLDAGSWFGEAFKGEKVPTLEEALDAIRGKAVADFDLKAASPERFVQALHAEFEKDPTLFERAAMYCSNTRLRSKVHELEPRLRIRPTVPRGVHGLPGLLSEWESPLVNIEWVDFSEELVRQVHLAGCKVVVNTHGRHDTELKMTAAIEAGADIIMTDRLDVLVPLLRKKGLHP